MQKYMRSYVLIMIALLLGVSTGLTEVSFFLKAAETVAALFMNFLRLLASPIVFLSILSTLLGMQGFDEMKTMGRKVFSYTLLTTLLATLTALGLFLFIDPVKSALSIEALSQEPSKDSYLSFFVNIIPSNLVQAFLENNVIGLAFVAFLAGIAALKLPEENKKVLNHFFSSLFKLVLKMTGLVIQLMPIGIWAFTTLLIKELNQSSSQIHTLVLYLSCVVGANLIQGFIILPLLLKLKGISPFHTAKGAMPALILAFFSKSSNAALPVSLQCAESTLGIKPKVANFSLPLCTVINMNGCAAFILTTVLFVAGSHGYTFSFLDLGIWVLLATIAAIGNAGVPMGCFFLSSTFLIALGVPITTMGLILPFYAFIDMVETSLNVWSDICVTSIVDKSLRKEHSLATV